MKKIMLILALAVIGSSLFVSQAQAAQGTGHKCHHHGHHHGHHHKQS